MPDFLKRHGIRADSILFNRLCGYDKEESGLVGVKMLQDHGDNAQLAQLALLTLCGFDEQSVSAFQQPVSNAFPLPSANLWKVLSPQESLPHSYLV